jgi:hypothetical protein
VKGRGSEGEWNDGESGKLRGSHTTNKSRDTNYTPIKYIQQSSMSVPPCIYLQKTLHHASGRGCVVYGVRREWTPLRV